ncbi:hypothetical protein [Paracoccus sp. 08]|uniref:hypothetical protein n=1 Tax=Paracoccus sp. 08 TaxID=2606624 RepID=UPI0020944DAA|nr:hypothetical protein [Paracoccus sp. 08]MCO6363990.1 hypothetical protein [Paracoccus sp. 08]
MTATPDLAILPLLALAGAAVWLTLACLTPRLNVLGFGLGLLMLLGRPTARRRAARLPTPAPMNTAEGQR